MGFMDKVKAQAEVGLAKATEATKRRPSTRQTGCSTTWALPSTPNGSGVPLSRLPRMPIGSSLISRHTRLSTETSSREPDAPRK